MTISSVEDADLRQLADMLRRDLSRADIERQLSVQRGHLAALVKRCISRGLISAEEAAPSNVSRADGAAIRDALARGMSVAQIAARMSISTSAVYRAIKTLRKSEAGRTDPVILARDADVAAKTTMRLRHTLSASLEAARVRFGVRDDFVVGLGSDDIIAMLAAEVPRGMTLMEYVGRIVMDALTDD